jgi:hypothetical protein
VKNISTDVDIDKKSVKSEKSKKADDKEEK